MIFIGYDSSNYGQKLAYEVCRRSLESKNTSIPISKLVKKDLEDSKIFQRTDNTGSTEFTYTRFLVPYICNYNGWAMFCDSDFLWFCDPQEVFDQCKDRSKAVYCVKHEYTECKGSVKMDDQKQEWYPRKNWSSLMVFNCSHPSVKNLSLQNINTKTGSWLHRMEWCEDKEIGELPIKYNYLVGYYDSNDYKALHFTDGGPWHSEYKDVEHGEKWLKYLDEKEKLYL